MPRPRTPTNEEQRRLVRTLSAYGVPQEQIARRIGIRSAKTLRKYYREELDRGAVDANAAVASDVVPDGHLGKMPTRHDLLAQNAGRLARAATA